MKKDIKNNTASKEDNKLQDKEDTSLGMGAEITRRDFVGGTLLGTGAALLSMAAPGVLRSARAQTFFSDTITGVGPEWTGPGGIGDYSKANGDTHVEVNAAHAGIRNRQFDKLMATAIETGELFDVIIVGGGTAGLVAAYTCNKERPQGKMLMLENHDMFGGEARMNEFDVDGTRLLAPQGPTVYNVAAPGFPQHRLATEIGLSDAMEHAVPTGLTDPNLKIAYDQWSPRLFTRSSASCGYVYGSQIVRNPWADGFKQAPVPEKVKKDLMWVLKTKERPIVPEGDVDKWLDSITYKELLMSVFKVDPGVIPYLEEGATVGALGLGADVVSAYLAKVLALPGAGLFNDEPISFEGVKGVELPGGTTGLVRLFLHKILPNVFTGKSMMDIMTAPINRQALDISGEPLRLRTGSTVIAARHNGPPSTSKSATVWYLKEGKLYKARAKGIVMAAQQQIGKRICQDLPTEYLASMAEFHHAPILVINVALRNWRFMEKLGLSGVRWVDGMGDFAFVTRKIKIEGKSYMPCDPNKPITMTMYQAFKIPGMPYPKQASAARKKMFDLSYTDVERQVRSQFQQAFGNAGFDAKRDIAGIITNRQGHAYITSPPGTFFGKDGKPPRAEILTQRYHRFAFGHSDLSGSQEWVTAAEHGERAARQILEAT